MSYKIHGALGLILIGLSAIGAAVFGSGANAHLPLTFLLTGMTFLGSCITLLIAKLKTPSGPSSHDASTKTPTAF